MFHQMFVGWKKTFAMKKSSKFLNFFFKLPLQSKPLIFVKMTRISLILTGIRFPRARFNSFSDKKNNVI